jgi:phage shock protein PspC (stress-responsive transcriptional regulator)
MSNEPLRTDARHEPREPKQLRKSRNRIIAGVCGGIAEWLGWDATLVRILYVLVSIFSAAFPGIIVYLVLWLVMPRPSEA